MVFTRERRSRSVCKHIGEIKKRGLVGLFRKPLDFITIEEGKKRSSTYSMRYKTKINKLNVWVGGVCVLYGSLTILLPTGSIFAIVGGLGLMFNPISIRLLLSNSCNDVRFFVLTASARAGNKVRGLL